MPINRNALKADLSANGNRLCGDVQSVSSELSATLADTEGLVSSCINRQAIPFILWNDFFNAAGTLSPKSGKRQYRYKWGDKVFVDFGCANIQTEISFPHPAIVLYNFSNTVIVAPTTSDDNPTFSSDIENVIIKAQRDGKVFPKDTVINLHQVKAVHKERIIGTHYWNPAYLIPLVEVVKTKYVSEETVKATYGLLEEAGKKPVIVKKDVPGFLANRMQHALFREALSIVEHDIADPEDVDKAIKYGFGMRLGICPPIEVMDMGGLDLTYAIHEYLFPHIENSTTPSRLLTENIEKGNLGFKSGKGIMDWPKESIEKANKELIDGLIKVAKALDRL